MFVVDARARSIINVLATEIVYSAWLLNVTRDGESRGRASSLQATRSRWARAFALKGGATCVNALWPSSKQSNSPVLCP